MICCSIRSTRSDMFAREVSFPPCSVLCSVKRRTFALRSLISNCTVALNSPRTVSLASWGWSRRLANPSTSRLMSSCSLITAVIEAHFEWVFLSIVFVMPSKCDQLPCVISRPDESPFFALRRTKCAWFVPRFVLDAANLGCFFAHSV